MNWDNVTLTILAAFGAAMLLAQLRELLIKLPAATQAWNEVRLSLQSRDADTGQPRD